VGVWGTVVVGVGVNGSAVGVVVLAATQRGNVVEMSGSDRGIGDPSNASTSSSYDTVVMSLFTRRSGSIVSSVASYPAHRTRHPRRPRSSCIRAMRWVI
jgi:hypothetical protein